MQNIKKNPAAVKLYRASAALGALPYQIWNQTFPGVIVLLYHRVGAAPADPHRLIVSPKNFDEQLEYIKNNANVISVADLKNALANRKVPKRSVVITFDDGYEDNYTNAFPLLKQYNLPATIFVTDKTEPNQEIWIDQLMQVIDAESKEYYEAFQRLQPLTATDRDKEIERLFHNKSLAPAVRSDYRRLTINQLQTMVHSKLITIGGHTVSHSRLSALTTEEQENEIARNFEFITSLGSQAVIPFAYPFGSRTDFTDQTVNIVKRYYLMAFTAYKGRMTTTTDVYHIPRFAVKNDEPKKFAKRLKGFWGHV